MPATLLPISSNLMNGSKLVLGRREASSLVKDGTRSQNVPSCVNMMRQPAKPARQPMHILSVKIHENSTFVNLVCACLRWVALCQDTEGIFPHFPLENLEMYGFAKLRLVPRARLVLGFPAITRPGMSRSCNKSCGVNRCEAKYEATGVYLNFQGGDDGEPIPFALRSDGLRSVEAVECKSDRQL